MRPTLMRLNYIGDCWASTAGYSPLDSLAPESTAHLNSVDWGIDGFGSCNLRPKVSHDFAAIIIASKA